MPSQRMTSQPLMNNPSVELAHNIERVLKVYNQDSIQTNQEVKSEYRG